MIDIDNNKEKFVRIVTEKITRNDTSALIAWLNFRSDFFEAPASSRHHLAEPGGLCQHSLNVYERLHKLLIDEYGSMRNCPYTEESIAIVALFHDLCKANMYKPNWCGLRRLTTRRICLKEPSSAKSQIQLP